ncbi:universal stress protein [Muricauda ruestringensis]|uniref:Universal stress protein n=1 Tax=Flagellimonas aurea TaxID=2915619 RepID=A0ABS3G3A1_9FLAO|nr:MULTISPECIES: universal stress protein [Allomuricauda]MBC73410.1 universal stress protein [Allomuricauda sp.]MBO0353884.1 universal stress protein [Allomuricauda aurea]|tara:strand:- start:29728 stop:30546 length:819 start_codon:yes stop_codon:yes gene_type:complete
MMGTILVATNFSKTSDNAVLYAAHLAKLFKAKLVLFNVFKLPVHASNTWLSAESMDAMVAVNRNRLKEQALGLSEEFGITVDYECRIMDLEREIDSLMEIHKARFLVMGMSAKSMEQNLMGNPTTTLISMKKFPVLAVPVNAKFMGIDKILFACDLMQGIPLRILVRLKQIALGLKSEVTVFYVEQKLDELKEDNDVFEHIDRGLENVVHFYKKVNSDKVIWEIEKEIIDSNSNLLVMIPKKYGFWESLIHRSKTREMASGLNIPMLSIPID